MTAIYGWLIGLIAGAIGALWIRECAKPVPPPGNLRFTCKTCGYMWRDKVGSIGAVCPRCGGDAVYKWAVE